MQNIAVTPNLHFNGECEKALEMYRKAFGGRLTTLIRYRDAEANDFPAEALSDEQRSYVYHAEMQIGSQRFFFSDSINKIAKGQNVSVVLTFDNIDAVKSVYDILSDGCTVIHPLCEKTYSGCFVSLADRFGIRWELMTEADPE